MTILETVEQLKTEIETEIAHNREVFTMAREVDSHIPYAEISEAIEQVANKHRMYVGSVRWIIRHDTFTAQVRIGLAKTLEHWVQKYGE